MDDKVDVVVNKKLEDSEVDDVNKIIEVDNNGTIPGSVGARSAR